MEEFKLNQEVRLFPDNESIYFIIEINPNIPKGITIRRFGDGFIVSVSHTEIISVKKDDANLN